MKLTLFADCFLRKKLKGRNIEIQKKKQKKTPILAEGNVFFYVNDRKNGTSWSSDDGVSWSQVLFFLSHPDCLLVAKAQQWRFANPMIVDLLTVTIDIHRVEALILAGGGGGGRGMIG